MQITRIQVTSVIQLMGDTNAREKCKRERD